MGQQAFKNAPLQPSGPGARSGGIPLTTFSIYSWVKGEGSWSRLVARAMMDGRSNFMSEGETVPRRLKQEGLLCRMIVNQCAILKREGRDIVLAIEFRGHCLEKFGVFISEFDPSNSASLFPIKFLVFEQSQQVCLQDGSKVHFGGRQNSFVLKLIQIC